MLSDRGASATVTIRVYSSQSLLIPANGMKTAFFVADDNSEIKGIA